MYQKLSGHRCRFSPSFLHRRWHRTYPHLLSSLQPVWLTLEPCLTLLHSTVWYIQNTKSWILYRSDSGQGLGSRLPYHTKQSFDISWLPGPLFFICKARPREAEAQCRWARQISQAVIPLSVCRKSWARSEGEAGVLTPGCPDSLQHWPRTHLNARVRGQ